MDFTGVYHKASEQMCYPLNEDELIVNLKTGYDVKRVFIYYGDPFEAGILGGKEQSGRKKRRDLFQEASEASSVVDYHIDTQVQAVQVLF